MQYPVTTLLLLVFFLQPSPGYMTRDNFPSTNGKFLFWDFDRVVGILPTGTLNSIRSLLNLEDGPVQAGIRQSIHNLAVPVISKPDLHTVGELQENVGNDVEGETDNKIVELLARNGNFNNVPSTNSNEINKRQLPILRLRKGIENPEIRATEDWIKHYFIQHGHTFLRGSRRLETDDDSINERKYSEDTGENKRDLSLLRLGKRQLPMLRLGKRHLPMLRVDTRHWSMFKLGKRHLPMLSLGKRQLPVLRLGKRQLPMLRLGKRQLPMLRLGKRQLPMLRLGKRHLPMLKLGKTLNFGDDETERQIMDMLSFDTPDSELFRFDSPDSRLSR